MTALLTADWYPYGNNKFFRKVEAYEMLWHKDVDLDNAVVIPGKFGGPIAVIKDRAKIVRMGLKGIGKPVIGIYTSAGRLISSLVWNSGHLVQLGWSDTEDLLCVQENGEVLIYSMFGKYIHAFRMGQEVEDTKVISANIFMTAAGTGVCVLTGAYRLFVTLSVKDPKVRKLAEMPGALGIPNNWDVVCEDRQIFVLLAKGTEMYYISEGKVIQKDIIGCDEERGSIITDISVSPDYKHVALYNSQEQLWIGSSNLRNNYRVYDMHGCGRPKELTWCGNEAVVGYWDESLYVIGRTEDMLTYMYDVTVTLVSEIDCVRVISTRYTDIIQPVPEVILNIYRINSTSPGSYLLEASKQFQKKHHRANEYIHLVKPQLSIAVNDCILAAAYEFNIENQKMLIRAAQFGKSFLSDHDPSLFVRMCRLLRVMNAVRNTNLGILITYPQFEHLTLEKMLDRLIYRRHYYMAIEAANYMKLSNERGSTRILKHWAFYKVSQLQVDKEQVANVIADKLGKNSGVSYIDIAERAAKNGRYNLAVKLIDYEPRASLQVSMLLKLEKYEDALLKAVESGNTDLISIAIINMQRKMSPKDFQLEIRKNPMVYSLYKKYCKENNKEALKNIYKQEDDHEELAACNIRNAYSPENFSTRLTFLESAKENYRNARNETNALLCEEQKKLLQKQKELEDKFKREFLDLSVYDTIYRLLIIQELKVAEDFKTLFKISDKRFWWLRIKALGELEDWVELEKVTRNKKFPLGFESIVDVCLNYGNKLEGMKYVSRVKEENKVKYHIKLGMYIEAIRTAESHRDLSALKFIQANCDTPASLEVVSAIARLTTYK